MRLERRAGRADVDAARVRPVDASFESVPEQLAERLARAWGGTVDRMWAGGLIQHLMQSLWDFLALPAGDPRRRVMGTLAGRDAAVLAVAGARPRAYRMATVAGAAGDLRAVWQLSRSPAPSTAGPVVSRLGWGLGWEIGLAWPAAPTWVGAAAPAALGLVETVAGGDRWRRSWREPMRDVLDGVMLWAAIRTTRDLFLAAVQDLAGQTAAEAAAAAEEARQGAEKAASERQFLLWHQRVLTSLADVRLRAETMAADDERYAGIAETASLVESRLRAELYRIAVGSDDVPLSPMVDGLVSARRAAGRLTRVRTAAPVGTAMLPSAVAVALVDVLRDVVELEAPIEVEVGQHTDGWLVRIATSAPTLGSWPGFRTVSSGETDGACVETVLAGA